MAITNGYTTLPTLKQRLENEAYLYTTSTLSFDSGTKTITDTDKGLRRFQTGSLIKISGSSDNDGVYTVATGDVAGSLVVSESLTTEAAGSEVTIRDVSHVRDDNQLEKLVNAVSRHFDDKLGRVFYATTETRYYKPEYTDELDVDDLLSVTTLKVDTTGDETYDTTWPSDDYYLLPRNAALRSKPYTHIQPSLSSAKSFPVGYYSVEIVGSFGYSTTTPPALEEACLLTVMRLFQRKDSIFGVTGLPDQGIRAILETDPDVKRLLQPFERGSYWLM